MKKNNILLVLTFLFLFLGCYHNFGMALSKSKIRLIVDKFEKKINSLKVESLKCSQEVRSFALKSKVIYTRRISNLAVSLTERTAVLEKLLVRIDDLALRGKTNDVQDLEIERRFENLLLLNVADLKFTCEVISLTDDEDIIKHGKNIKGIQEKLSDCLKNIIREFK